MHIAPSTVQTPALDAIDRALLELIDTPDGRLIITMPPQEGKSSRVARDFPLWMLTHSPDTRIITASYGAALAVRNGRAIRRRVVVHPELGLRIAPDNGSVSDWTIDGHEGGVLSVGIGGAITGRPCDLLIIDDPIKSRAEADSETYRERAWDWWTDEAAARLAPGAPVVLILTRWHHDDLAARLIAEPDSSWRVLNIAAQCTDPETDPLGRAAGEYMVSARGRTVAQWVKRRETVGARTWAAQYQGSPTPDTGMMFPASAWARYNSPPWIVRGDGARIVPDAGTTTDVELVQSWDFTFKDTGGSDYVVGQVWLRRGATAYLLDQTRRRAGFAESVQMMLDLTARWPQAVMKLVEDKANGPAIINALRAKIGGIIPVEPEGSKVARASAITPLVESGNVVLPDPLIDGCAWVSELTDEARDFPSGKHDDTVDAMSQAVHRLLLVPILTGTDLTVLTDDDDDGALPWAASY